MIMIGGAIGLVKVPIWLLTFSNKEMCWLVSPVFVTSATPCCVYIADEICYLSLCMSSWTCVYMDE